MENLYNLEIITPERRFFSENVEMVCLKTPEGEIGILKNHMAMVTAVKAGPIRILQGGAWLEAVLSEGFMEIKQDGTIIFTDSAEWVRGKI